MVFQPPKQGFGIQIINSGDADFFFQGNVFFLALAKVNGASAFSFAFLYLMAGQLLMYTDGAARGNPGRGGFGTLLIWGEQRREISGAYRHTTNNRMELMAVISGLEALTREGLDVVIYSDSRYVVDAVQKGWLHGWVKKDFKDKKNPDLWMRYYRLQQKYRIRFVWVKGHADNPLNNRCDVLATTAADNGPWLEDVGMEKAQGRL